MCRADDHARSHNARKGLLMSSYRIALVALLCAAALLAGCANTASMQPGKPEFMVVGIDNKVTWGEDGKL